MSVSEYVKNLEKILEEKDPVSFHVHEIGPNTEGFKTYRFVFDNDEIQVTVRRAETIDFERETADMLQEKGYYCRVEFTSPAHYIYLCSRDSGE